MVKGLHDQHTDRRTPPVVEVRSLRRRTSKTLDSIMKVSNWSGCAKHEHAYHANLNITLIDNLILVLTTLTPRNTQIQHFLRRGFESSRGREEHFRGNFA